jgi:hypothetical protein
VLTHPLTDHVVDFALGETRKLHKEHLIAKARETDENTREGDERGGGEGVI